MKRRPPRRRPRRPAADADRLHGIAPVEEALAARRRRLDRLFLREGKPSPKLAALARAAEAAGIPVEARSVHELVELAGNRHHQGAVLECGPLPTLDPATWLDDAGEDVLLLALDQVEDPQNLGGLVRTAAFLGADAVLALPIKAAPLSPAASKASAGTLERFPILIAPNLAQALDRLRDHGFFVIGSALDDDAVSYEEESGARRTVLVVGNEGEGLRALTRKRCDRLVRIPGRGAESLNVTVAAGILLRHLVRSAGERTSS